MLSYTGAVKKLLILIALLWINKIFSWNKPDEINMSLLYGRTGYNRFIDMHKNTRLNHPGGNSVFHYCSPWWSQASYGVRFLLKGMIYHVGQSGIKVCPIGPLLFIHLHNICVCIQLYNIWPSNRDEIENAVVQNRLILPNGQDNM